MAEPEPKSNTVAPSPQPERPYSREQLLAFHTPGLCETRTRCSQLRSVSGAPRLNQRPQHGPRCGAGGPGHSRGSVRDVSEIRNRPCDAYWWVPHGAVSDAYTQARL